MSREILLLVDALAREKNVGRDIVLAALERALESATKKQFREDADVHVAIDQETGSYQSFRRWQVVEIDIVEDLVIEPMVRAISVFDGCFPTQVSNN